MPDLLGARLLRLSAGGIGGVQWRPTRFEGGTLDRYACSLCGVIPSSTFLLPCTHALCEVCKNGCALNCTSSVCPLDQEQFDEEECCRVILPQCRIRSLKVHCWNQVHGCSYVGTLPSVLRHYEEDCAFHEVECPRCGDSVLRIILVAHYTTGCHNIAPSDATNSTSPGDSHVCGASDVDAALDELKALLRAPYQTQLPAVESQMNRLTEDMANQGALLLKTLETLAVIKDSLNSEPTGSENSAPVKVQLQVEGEEFTRKPRPGSVQEERAVVDAPLPWYLEKKHTLRRLESLTSQSLAYLEDLHQTAVKQLERPIARCELYHDSSCWGVEDGMLAYSFRRRREDDERVLYRCNVKNIRPFFVGCIPEWTTLLVVNKWHWKDSCLRITVVARYEVLVLCFSFEGTLETSRLSHVESVVLRDSSGTESVAFEKVKEGSFPGILFESQQAFWSEGVLSDRQRLLAIDELNFFITVVDN